MTSTSSSQIPRLCLVVPCYHEEEVLPETLSRLTELLNKIITRNLIAPDSYMLLVDDGSTDTTWDLIENYSNDSSLVEGLKLSRNQGHQNAVFAGLIEGSGDIFISIDADLQDDITVIEKMVEEHLKNGTDIVFGVRADRSSDSAFKRLTAEGYYRFLSVMGVEVIFNHADYRLMSARAVRALGSYREVHLFLRGLVPLIGFKTETIEYSRAERFAGTSKYPLSKMLSLAWEGVTSFSARPLRMISFAGFIISILSFIAVALSILASFMGATITGWPSIMVTVTFLGGIQLLSIGLIGEYVGKIYIEIKDRPRYFIDINTREDRDK